MSTYDAIFVLAVVIAAILLHRAWRLRDLIQLQLHAREVHTEEIIRNANQAYFEINSKGIVVDWNARAEEILGWGRNEVIGRHVATVLPSQQRRDLTRAILKHLVFDQGKTNVYLETQTTPRNADSSIYVGINMWKTIIDGQVHLAALISDITERRRIEEERECLLKKQNQLLEELRQADKVKADLISTISHELRTPLTSIVGYTEMLRAGFGGDLQPQQIAMVDIVDRNSQRILSLIEDVLTWSRIEENVVSINKLTIDVESLINSAQQALIPLVKEKQLNLTIDTTEAGEVSGDMNQLERVILNLLSNAVKFTPNGGNVSLIAKTEKDATTIEVKDSGIGIAKDELGRLFEKFYRATNAQANATTGTGLGLTIVRKIIQNHGGTIAIDSELNVGTTVTVKLPTVESVIEAADVIATS